MKSYLSETWDCSIEYNENSGTNGYWISFGNSFGKKGFKKFSFDKNNIPCYKLVNSGFAYFPTFVGWWGFHMLNLYETCKDKFDKEKYFDNFLKQADWFVDNVKIVKINNIKCAVWYYNFDWKEGLAVLKKPWVSALGQGVSASTLIRAYSLTKKTKYKELALMATRIFQIDVSKGGVLVKKNGFHYYEEYPAKPYAHVFDGFVFSLLGLYDVYQVTKDKKVKKLFENGIKSISRRNIMWNFMNCWSYYGSHKILSDVYYNKLNSAQMYALWTITKKDILRKYAIAWNPRNLKLFQKFLVWSMKKILVYIFVFRMVIKGGHF